MLDKVNTAVRVDDRTTEIQKHEERPVHVAIIYDLTASREPTRDAHVRQFRTQMDSLKEAAGKVVISLVVYNRDGADFIGRYTNPIDVGHALAKQSCSSSRTHINGAMKSLSQNLSSKDKPDAIIHIGDTTDGDNREMLVAAAKSFGKPIITLLERTFNQAGTQQEHIDAMAAMSRASGIVGCPIEYRADIKFADYFAVIAASIKHKNDPKAMAEVLNKVDPRVAALFPNDVRESIAHPGTVPQPVVPPKPTPVAQSALKPKKKGSFRGSHLITWPSELLNGLAVFGVAALVMLGVKNGEKVETVLAPPPVAKPVKAPDLLKGDIVVVSDKDRVLFETGSADLSPDFKTYLDALAKKVIANPDKCVLLQVSGHTDPRGSDEHNNRLSLDRANVVRNYLRTLGVNRGQIKTFGFGKTQLLTREPGMSNVDYNQVNRRVTFQCSAIQSPTSGPTP